MATPNALMSARARNLGQAPDESARVGEEVEQLLAGEMVLGAAGFGEFQQVQVSVPAPVDDVVAAVSWICACNRSRVTPWVRKSATTRRCG